MNMRTTVNCVGSQRRKRCVDRWEDTASPCWQTVCGNTVLINSDSSLHAGTPAASPALPASTPRQISLQDQHQPMLESLRWLSFKQWWKPLLFTSEFKDLINLDILICCGCWTYISHPSNFKCWFIYYCYYYWYLRHGFMYSKLVSNLLCSKLWPWIPDPMTPTSWVLEL